MTTHSKLAARVRPGFRGVLALLAAAAVMTAEARANDYKAKGGVYFTNLQAATQVGALVPYVGFSQSKSTGHAVQTGSIRNLSGLIPVNANTFIFYGEVGPHPWFPNHPSVHVIETENGNIFCSWTATFTLRILNARGDAVFSGDGAFDVHGGTGRWSKASGHFRTLFTTAPAPVPATANDAFATVSQDGKLKR